MFKEIRAKFYVVGETDSGKQYSYDFVIERLESGAFKYGDHSCHTLKLYAHDNEDKVLRDDYYDTRYDHISTDKDKWVKEWKDFIQDNWLNVKSVELLDYEENLVEER